MKRLLSLSISLLTTLTFVGCAAWQNVAYTDDLYAIHDKIAIANKQKAEAELAKAEAEARQAQYEAALAKIKAQAAQQGVTVKEGSVADLVDSYDSVLADSYESAYARRLYGFSSASYRMPSSYYMLRYNDAFIYSSAYDPAFYNVMVSGDLVWVEPKYITSMFGTWGAAVVPSYNWYYGWYSPWNYWGWSYRYNPYFARYPYHWDWGCNWYWGYNRYWGWGHHHYFPHRPHRPHRPHYGHGGVGNTGHHGYRPSVGRNPRATTPSVREGSTYRPSQPATGRGGSESYNSRSGSTDRNYGNSYNSGGSSTYRRSSSSSSSSSSSYNRGSSSSYNRGSSSSSSYSGGSRSSSYSGGNSRGR